MVQTVPVDNSSVSSASSTETSLISIFIADQHPVVRLGMVGTIQQDDSMQIVGESNNGMETLEQVQKLQPDVVITDIGLESLSGIDVAQKIAETLPDTSVIIFTDCTQEGQMLKALRVGAKGYILKNISIDELSSAIRTVHAGEVCISPVMASKLVDSYVSRSTSDNDRYYWLSEREREVLPMLAQGNTHSEIGQMLELSPYTIQTYRQRIMRKLDLHSEAEILKYALSKGLISLDS